MGKRSDFERKPRDSYWTPYEAVIPLLPHLHKGSTFEEPCAGNGQLQDFIEQAGHLCTYSCDIEPQRNDIAKFDAFHINKTNADFFITNPPWDRKILHPLIVHLSDIAPTWLLFDADWMHTKQSAELMKRCVKVVSVGRVKWIPDSKMTGKDNCAWYLFFGLDGTEFSTRFVGRELPEMRAAE
ncbi:hypothetical protein [Kiloniella antarctica]|uniref:Methyltransferase n=1 Tax=Kiloniella antarctica TaxID=1550907 RepID=A0ABW5BP18_9PROT